MHGIDTSWLDAEGMDVYLAQPTDGTCKGAVIVAMEVYGVTRHIRRVCERLAKHGYAALAPNFYWRDLPGEALGYEGAERERGFNLMRALTRDMALTDIQQAYALARTYHRHIAFAGFCFGGHIALLAATQQDYALVASFYGGGVLKSDLPIAQPHPPLHYAEHIKKHANPVLCIFGGADEHIPAETRDGIEAALDAAEVDYELVVYEGAQHGFCCEDRPAYHPQRAEEAWQKWLAELARRLPA